ncbi:molybdopterin-synthase adenylyltransferase MoeB [Cytophagaceae bacterium ABcell3]|nr:molybdopterin-synthase adenylyltransferase MoeB [Cytophagaceae bacterium ABcell3]
MLTPEELKRYNRHIILPEFGKEAQEKLKNASVLVIGAGGLGCPVLLYLTAAGVGTIGIVDFDTVDKSNLHRQVLFSVKDTGKLKAEVAAEKLAEQNPFVNFKVHTEKLDRENAQALFAQYDLVVDGSDNFPTRYLVSDVCTIQNKPLIFGSIFKFQGQVSVFNYVDESGKKGPTYRCLFPEPPSPGSVPNCATIGVLGVLPGMIGSIQANEAIKVITGIGQPLVGRLMMLDALSMETTTIKIMAVEENFKRTNLEADYEAFCNPPTPMPETETEEYKEISVKTLEQKLNAQEDIFLLDVREPHESEICQITGSTLIPMRSVSEQVEKIPEDKPVVVYCHHGMRSAWVVKFLSDEFNYKNLYNLEGGIDQWAAKVDKGMSRY